MRLAITGGGTGGHVYPALELARQARDRGIDVLYIGSLRGQEGKACEREEVPFVGFPSGPVYSLKTARGWAALLRILRASAMAGKALDRFDPHAVLSTGGYSSAPVVRAAAGRGIPYVIHEQNSVPGRTNVLFSKKAHAVATVFRSGAEHFPKARVVRTGMPIRREIRESAQGSFRFQHRLPGDQPIVFVVGGSQGSAAVNEAALATAVRMARSEVQWLHVAGPNNYDAAMNTLRKLGVGDNYELRAYLDAEEMGAALFSCSVVVGRSGGSIAEIAAYRKPSVLIPLPTAFANHQLMNAREFEAMGAASVVEQSSMTPADLEGRILMWIHDTAKREAAAAALAEWDISDAADRILSLIEEAAA